MILSYVHLLVFSPIEKTKTRRLPGSKRILLSCMWFSNVI
ncbi:hypothetical protein KIS4809_2437 [Bacillus sp. ZZV12-4809]|nr:hypothetical protein KIS4809_2437 [Bacillus sp. ZZV12-4809]